MRLCSRTIIATHRAARGIRSQSQTRKPVHTFQATADAACSRPFSRSQCSQEVPPGTACAGDGRSTSTDGYVYNEPLRRTLMNARRSAIVRHRSHDGSAILLCSAQAARSRVITCAECAGYRKRELLVLSTFREGLVSCGYRLISQRSPIPGSPHVAFCLLLLTELFLTESTWESTWKAWVSAANASISSG